MTGARSSDSDAKGLRPRPLAIIYVSVALDTVAAGLIMPILPRLLQDLGQDGEPGAAYALSLFVFSFALTQFFAAPIQGALSDRFGRRPLIIASSFGLVIDYVVMGLATSVGWLVVGRIMAGVFAGSVAPAYAYIVDVSPSESRAARFGYIGAAAAVGAILGPALGGALGQIDTRAPFWAAAIMSFLSGGYALFFLPESLPRGARSALQVSRMHPIGAMTALVRDYPVLRVWALVQATVTFAAYGYSSVLALYATFRFGWSPAVLGAFFVTLALAHIAAQVLLTGTVVKRLGERKAILAGLAVQAVGLLAAAAAETPTGFWVAILLLSLGGFAGPALSSLVTQVVGPSEQGRLMGAARSLGSAVAIIAPPLFAMILAFSFAEQRLLGMPVGTPFIAAAVLSIIAIGVCLWAWRSVAEGRV